MRNLDDAKDIYAYLVKELGPMSSTSLRLLSTLFRMAEEYESMPMSLQAMEQKIKDAVIDALELRVGKHHD